MATARDKNGKKQDDGSGGADLLRKAIDGKDWTLHKAADELGVSVATVSRWLGGSRVPGREHMKKLRDMFGIPPQIWV